MNKDFKVGDTVKIVGHPLIKEGTLATVLISGMLFDDGWFKVEFVSDNRDFWIDVKYLEKVEDWSHYFKITNIDSDPYEYYLMSLRDKLDKEVRLYNRMYQWKQKFDPEEVEWGNDKEDRWFISRSFGIWHTSYSYGVRQNLEVYFTTEEKAEQCLEWLKKEGVLY